MRAFVGADAGFGQLDADFIRVLEDLIDVLIQRKVINVTDLPTDARRKLYSRKGRRHASPLSALGLLGDSDSDGDGDNHSGGDSHSNHSTAADDAA